LTGNDFDTAINFIATTTSILTPKRTNILSIISEKECTFDELKKKYNARYNLGIPQTTLHSNLRKLLFAGLINKDGNWPAHYTLSELGLMLAELGTKIKKAKIAELTRKISMLGG